MRLILILVIFLAGCGNKTIPVHIPEFKQRKTESEVSKETSNIYNKSSWQKLDSFMALEKKTQLIFERAREALKDALDIGYDVSALLDMLVTATCEYDVGSYNRAIEIAEEVYRQALELSAQHGFDFYLVRNWHTTKDCLWNIAKLKYDDPEKWPIIFRANSDKIKNPDLIYPNQRLIIPICPKK